MTLLLSLATLTACTDEETDALGLEYPATFSIAKTHNTTPVRMYTQAGEVKDGTLIKAFVQKWDDGYFLENKVETISSGESLVFQNSSLVELQNGSTNEAYEVSQKEGELLFTSKKEFSIFVQPSNNHYTQVSKGILKYKPLEYDFKKVPTGTGIQEMYTTKRQLVATLKGQELHVYTLKYTLKSGDQNSYAVNSMTQSNLFDPSGLSNLAAKDTLVVQEFVIVADKK
ncbi:hypothetical protein TH61_12800 [Rufibacter sp. DG15C]|nr:hypothetical protein TH61_12800 [Rufibacter sp. DG15C]